MRHRMVLSHFLRFLLPYRWSLVFVGVSTVSSALLSLAYPVVLRRVIDQWSAGAQAPNAPQSLATLAGALVLQALLSFSGQYVYVLVAQRVLGDVRVDLLRRVLGKPIGFFSCEHQGQVVSVFLNDVATIGGALTGGFLSLLVNLTALMAMLGLMAAIQWQVTLATAGFMAVFLAIYAALGPSVRRLSVVHHQALADVSGKLNEAYSGVRVIKAFNREQAFEDRFSRSIDKSVSAASALGRRSLLMTSSSGATTGVALLAGLALAGTAVTAGRMTLGSAVAYLSLLSGSFSPLVGVINASVSYRTALAAAERVATLAIASAGTVVGGDRCASLRPSSACTPVVRFHDVCFEREGREVLSDLNLEILAGERVAIRGRSGIGKSTIVDLILKFEEPTSGEIRFMGHSLKETPAEWVRERVAVVPQDPFLFNMTLRENLLIANPRASDLQLDAAIKGVGLGEFLSRLPKGLDSPMGERGVCLSGGERQRIAIARAILADGDIVVFDEPTAWLDSATERLLWGNVAEALGDRAVVLITHDEGTSLRVDRTLVLDEGRLERPC